MCLLYMYHKLHSFFILLTLNIFCICFYNLYCLTAVNLIKYFFAVSFFMFQLYNHFQFFLSATFFDTSLLSRKKVYLQKMLALLLYYIFTLYKIFIACLFLGCICIVAAFYCIWWKHCIFIHIFF